MDGSRILRRLDDPWKLGLWEMDVAGTFVFFLMLGLMKGSITAFFLSAVVGWFASTRISKLKAMRHTGFLWHFLFWWLPQEAMFIPRGIVPPSHYREMVG
ncbi:MAG: type IV conjugative transfer system protein TraL [Hydrogenophilales bacterium]|nr:type IV conjugative transfer system protein TraL [Hydrogenophilales bacterium]